ncbi:MAG: DoxX family protein [Leptospiraceae bacterium]|nr:DoxX family protein [Leptospiraceae bacterium]
MPFTLIGRILFSLPMIGFGLGHLTSAANMAAMVPAWLPGGVFWVYLTGVALVAAGIAIIINKLTFQAALGLSVLVMTFALTVHLPGMLKGEGMAKMMSMVALYKDIAISGAALYIAGQSRS